MVARKSLLARFAASADSFACWRVVSESCRSNSCPIHCAVSFKNVFSYPVNALVRGAWPEKLNAPYMAPFTKIGMPAKAWGEPDGSLAGGLQSDWSRDEKEIASRDWIVHSQ